MQVKLTDFEMRMLEYVGIRRLEHALDRHRDPGAGPSSVNRRDASNHIRGARTEFAASIMLNQYWRRTVGQIRERDVGGMIDVRSTVLPDGRLIVKPADNDEVPFVLVVEDGSRFRSPGWMTAGEAKRFPLQHGHGDPAHFIGQRDLRPLSELRRRIADERYERIAA